MEFDDVQAEHQVFGDLLVGEALLCPPLLFIPAAGSTIQFRYQRWLLLLEQGAQRFGEERMVAIPGVGVIECTDKEICLEQACQLPLSTTLCGHALAKRPGEALQLGVPGRSINQHDHVLTFLFVHQTAVTNRSGGW